MLASPDPSRGPLASNSSPSLVRLPVARAVRLVGAAESHPLPLHAAEQAVDDGTPDRAPDLRRKRSRDGVDLLLERARFAAPAEAALVRAVFRKGVTGADVARAAGVGAPTVRRRLKRIVARLLSARFAFVVGHMGSWPEDRRRVGATVVVRGLSVRAASIRLGLSIHRVRTEMGRVNAAFEAHQALTRRAGRPWRAPSPDDAVIGRIGPLTRNKGIAP